MEINGDGKLNWPFLNLLAVVLLGFFVTIGIITDAITMSMMIDLIKEFGVPGIVFVLWHLSNRANQKTMQQYREDTLGNKDQYEKGLSEVRQMYENNVHLAKSYDSLAKDLRDVVIMNTQAMTRVCDDVKNNNFCPMVRKASGEE